MRRAVRNPVLLVIAGLMLLQTAWILTIPPFRGSDEFDHAYRAAAVAGGEWVAGPEAEDGRGLLVEVPDSLVTAAHAQCDKLSYTGPDNCSPAAEVSQGRVLVASGAATYHPAFYWVVGTTASPFDGAAALYAMRITAVVLCLLFLSLAVLATRSMPGPWPMAGLILAATPVFIYSTTIPGPNGLEMSAALALWASLLAIARASDRASTGLFAIAIASAMVLGTLRLIGPLFVLLIVATVAVLEWRRVLDAVRSRSRTVLVGCLLVGAAVASFAAWTLGPGTPEGRSGELDGDASFKLAHLIVWPLQTIAAFPYRDQMGAAIIYPVVGALVVTLVVVAFRLGDRAQRATLLGSVATALLLPVVLTLFTMDSTGVIWQGRYGLPYSVGPILVAGYIVGQRLERGALPWRLTIPATIAYGTAIAACLIKVRNNELAGNPASANDHAWLAPHPVLLAAFSGLAIALFAFAVSSKQTPEPLTNGVSSSLR